MSLDIRKIIFLFLLAAFLNVIWHFTFNSRDITFITGITFLLLFFIFKKILSRVLPAHPIYHHLNPDTLTIQLATFSLTYIKLGMFGKNIALLVAIISVLLISSIVLFLDNFQQYEDGPPLN